METVEGTPIKKEGIEALFKTYTDNSGKYEGKMQDVYKRQAKTW